MVLFLSDMRWRVFGRWCCLLANALNVYLAGAIRVKRNKIVIAGTLVKLQGCVARMVKADGITDGTQITLKMLPEQEAKKCCLLFRVRRFSRASVVRQRYFKALNSGDIWVAQHSNTSHETGQRERNSTTSITPALRKGRATAPHGYVLHQDECLQHRHK